MAASYISVPRDLTKVKSKVMFNLTKRQLICFSVAALFGVPSFFLIKQIASVSTAAMGMMVIMMPFFFLAMYEKNGQHLEVLLGHLIEATFVRPKQRPYKGYFSIDKKGRAVDSEVKRGSDISDDISAYDLILKNKERLLSFNEPTRFIFSHSALREGWDNPNVFQICTLKHSDSTTTKRQEVGRGLRLCVNQDGFRMDEQSIGLQMVHKINKLTVIASESYKDFVTDLQKQIRTDLYERPRKASMDYFQGKTIIVNGTPEKITQQQAAMIYQYMIKNDYVSSDGEDHVTEQYVIDLENNNLAPVPEHLLAYADGIHKLILMENLVLNMHVQML